MPTTPLLRHLQSALASSSAVASFSRYIALHADRRACVCGGGWREQTCASRDRLVEHLVNRRPPGAPAAPGRALHAAGHRSERGGRSGRESRRCTGARSRRTHQPARSVGHYGAIRSLGQRNQVTSALTPATKTVITRRTTSWYPARIHRPESLPRRREVARPACQSAASTVVAVQPLSPSSAGLRGRK
jgi:hypothetical protein